VYDIASLLCKAGLEAQENGHLTALLAEWIHLDAIKALVHHTSAVIAAAVLFALVGFVVQRLLHDGPIKRAVLLVDEVVLLCLFVYFAYELLGSLL
jgi:hypothetical protein